MTVLLFVMHFFIKISGKFHSTVKKEGVIKMINLIILIHPLFIYIFNNSNRSSIVNSERDVNIRLFSRK